jgi:hypothetical protein
MKSFLATTAALLLIVATVLVVGVVLIAKVRADELPELPACNPGITKCGVPLTCTDESG